MNGSIYTSEFHNLADTIKRTYNLVRLVEPDILSGTVVYKNKEYDIFYNEMFIESGYLSYRLLYTPRKDYTTVMTIYCKLEKIKLNNTQLTIESIMVDGETPNNEQSNTKITLSLAIEAAKYLETISHLNTPI